MSRRTLEKAFGEQIPEMPLPELEVLLKELDRPAESQCELLREHLQSARTYLLGAMPEEYGLSLRMAGEALDCVSDEKLRDRISDFLRSQLQIH